MGQGPTRMGPLLTVPWGGGNGVLPFGARASRSRPTDPPTYPRQERSLTSSCQCLITTRAPQLSTCTFLDPDSASQLCCLLSVCPLTPPPPSTASEAAVAVEWHQQHHPWNLFKGPEIMAQYAAAVRIRMVSPLTVDLCSGPEL